MSAPHTHMRILSKLCSKRIRNNIMLGLDGWEEHKARVQEVKNRRIEEMTKVALEKDEEILKLNRKLQLTDIQLEMLQKELNDPGTTRFHTILLEDMGFTVRTFNTLRKKGFYTIDGIMKSYSSFDELTRIDGIGKAGAYEILATVRRWYPEWLA